MKISSENQLPPEIIELFQIHPELKAFADKLAAHDNEEKTNSYSFPQDDEIKYKEAKEQDGKTVNFM